LSDDFTPHEAKVRAGLALDRVGARSCADTRIDRLSAGERIRVELARALAREPRLLLVDEPAVLPGLSERRELYAVLRSLGADPGLALLVASEDLDAVVGARRIMSIDSGQVRSTDSRDNLIHLPGLRAGGGDSAVS
jgi:ABC-type Mn2+/Zn2+ transport system ATPase subunit